MPTKQPSLQFSVMCLDLIEEERKPPTFQYLFYELPFPHLPFRMDRFHVINCWSNGEGQYKQEVKILDPARKEVFIKTGEQNFNLEDPFTPQLMINVFADLEFKEQGHYWVQTFLNDKMVLEYPLTVRLVETGQKPGGPPSPKEKEKGKPTSPPVPPKKPSAPSIGPITTDEWNIPN